MYVLGVVLFWWNWNLYSGLRAYKADLNSPLVHSALVILETGSRGKVFALASLEPRSS
jgi:hypothetical protein